MRKVEYWKHNLTTFYWEITDPLSIQKTRKTQIPPLRITLFSLNEMRQFIDISRY